jgi:LacI family transcriptional regulator
MNERHRDNAADDPPPGRTVTLRDVAKRAGVSIATASRALNRSGYASVEARERIAQAVRELGYVPSPLAQGLSGQSSGVLGLIVPELDDPYWSEIAEVVEGQARLHGSGLIMAASHWDTSQEDEAVRMIARYRPDGVIFCAPANCSNIAVLHRQRVPVVVRGNCANGRVLQVDQVLGDERRGGYVATQHLIDLGHRHILFLGHPKRSGAVQPRYSGYHQALTEHGLQPRSLPWNIKRDKDAFPNGLSLALEEENKPTALFAPSDYVAIHVWDWLERYGVRVPEDVSLVGYGDSSYGRLMRCGLTTIDESKEAQTDWAMRLLIERIEGEGETPARQHLVSTSLIVRESSQPLVH